LWAVILLAALRAGPQAWCGCACAQGWQEGARLAVSSGGDNNIFENDEEVGDGFVRLLGEGTLARTGLPWQGRAELSGIFSSEQFFRQTTEARTQGEATLRLTGGGLGRALQGRLEGGYKVSSYPSDSDRNYWRGWGRAQLSIPAGPSGRLMPRLEYWTLDLRRNARREEKALALDLSYEQPLVGRFDLLRAFKVRVSLLGGLEFGGIHHGFSSIQIEKETDLPIYGPDRDDSYRHAHIGLQFMGGGLYRLEYGYRSRQSNSIDAESRRHEIRWLASTRLPWNVSLQLYGMLEHTSYVNIAELDRYFIQRSGELEANPDDNLVAVRLARPVARGWSVEARSAWYRNESLVVREYYRKQVWTVGITWESGLLSTF